MSVLVWIIAATLIVSAGAFAGVVTLALHEKKLQRLLLHLVSLSAGTLIGSAFLHLLPEAVEHGHAHQVFELTLASFIGFFLIEKGLHWRHCHRGHCDVHQFGYLNLIGDAVHNFIDGLIIAATFMVDINLGIITTIAVASHEIPQEIGDFGVLLYSGFSKTKALISNVLVALTAVAGGIIGYFLNDRVEAFSEMLLPIAAGGFIYIAASDLMPEIRRETNRRRSIISFTLFLLGIGLMYVLTLVSGH
jgi:zinc and cadmium transporter